MGLTWDAIVVGAGQAGCAAAYDLAARGQRVLILDRQDLPRVKACAGGVTVKALNLLRFSIAPVVRCVVRDIALSTDGSAPRPIGGSAPMLVTTVRSELDRFCLDRAIEQGAQFAACGDDRITGVEQGGRAVSLRLASGKSLAARFVVAADGANSTIRRLLGLGQVPRAFALEGHVPMDCANLHRDVAACASGARTFYGRRRMRRAAVGLRPVKSAFRDGFAAGMPFRDIAIAVPFYPLFAIRPVETVVHHESGMALQPQ